MKVRTIFRLSVLVLSCTVAPALWAAPPQKDKDAKDQEVPTFRANVNVVNLFFNVKDKHGALIPNLTKDDFQVLEDGKPQTIKYFSAESNQPLTLGILIDSSGSQTRVLGMEKEAGSEFLRDVLRPKDLAFVISFDVNVDLLQDFTSSPRELRAALESAKINAGGASGGLPGLGGGPFPTSNNPRGTLLYDAIYLASREKLGNEVGRKAMIILTDGEDQGSKLKIKDAIEAAQKSDSLCYVIMIADRGYYSSYGTYGGDREMRKLTEETGGRMIDVGDRLEKLKKAFAEISAELRSQYSLGYTPSNPKLDGTFRKVEIKASHDYRVQARKGYYATKAQTGD